MCIKGKVLASNWLSGDDMQCTYPFHGYCDDNDSDVDLLLSSGSCTWKKAMREEIKRTRVMQRYLIRNSQLMRE